MKPYKFFHSVTRWEESYFGGYEQLLEDYPPIVVPESIVTNFPDYCKTYVPYMYRQKLIDMFLFSISVNKTLKNLFSKNGTIITLTNPLTQQEQKFSKVTDEILRICFREVVKLETELGSLFEYYKEFILGTEYLFQLPDDKKDKKGKGGGSEDETNDEEQGSGMSEIEYQLKCNEVCSNSMGKIQKGKSKFELKKNISTRFKKSDVSYTQMKKCNEPTYYTNDEVSMSNRLVNLLDVSFDPCSDIVNSLKFGKLDVKKIAEIPSGNQNVYYTTQENQNTRPFSVCILGDESGSMSGKKIQCQKSMMKVLYRTFKQILPDDKIFVYGHSGMDKPNIRVYQDKYFDGFEHTIDRMTKNSLEENYDGVVIESVYEKVRTFTNDNILFISLSDGSPSGHNYGSNKDIEEMKQVIERCKRDGFVTLGIGIEDTFVKQIYQYHTIVNPNREDDRNVLTGISTLVNRVVKSEFQN